MLLTPSEIVQDRVPLFVANALTVDDTAVEEEVGVVALPDPTVLTTLQEYVYEPVPPPTVTDVEEVVPLPFGDPSAPVPDTALG
jgi:hypothetical protein